jgi:alpha-tubulin N-acetyltransferase 1
MFTSGDNRLYLKMDPATNKVIGLIKVGVRKLFVHRETGQIKEISPLCVLDFYVHESIQRGGYGKIIFEHMIKRENIDPAKMAYDRPSEKLIGFLGKHYGLKNYVP